METFNDLLSVNKKESKIIICPEQVKFVNKNVI